MTPYIWQKSNLDNALISLKPTWQGSFDGIATRICTDTRTLTQGDIFLAIKGDNFDGHDYVGRAFDSGAVLVIVDKQQACDIPQLIVDDTRLALGQLGAYRRACHRDVKVVAITGSSGKTSTKQMLGAILNQVAPTLITRGNLNNDLGVPMTLLELCDEHRFAVIELGANHIGEIAYTSKLVQPDVACVLNIGTAHLGEFGGRDGIAQAKAEIFAGLTGDGVAVLPFADDYFETLLVAAQEKTKHCLSFGEREVSLSQAGICGDDIAQMGILDSDQVLLAGDAFADDVAILSAGSEFKLCVNMDENDTPSVDVILNLAGEHNVDNALAAAACALALDVPLNCIADGLQATTNAKGRLNFRPFGEHMIIDDTYNANPTSVLAAANVLACQDNTKILVLGDIGELGEKAVDEHAQLGVALAQMPIDALLAVGDLMSFAVAAAHKQRTDFAIHFACKADLVAYLQTLMANQACSLLFKGSRFMVMESIITTICTKKQDERTK